ncbi:MAG: hypothetical protein NC827_01670 [Candidatus Omnitrophica bacterium]|nr:hypothetical protein [Candidatus Omnitrophota bacterium]MCM8802003.1 hypothetical protein [Candidatus Omnitrophota bacterium]
MEKKKITLAILILFFVFTWGWQLKPKRGKISKKIDDQNVIVEKETIGGIDLREIENNFSEIKKKIDEFKLSKLEKIKITKDPLKEWVIKKGPEIIVKEIEKKEPIKPDFKISGIVYDKKNPYVIINNEIKEEGEKISNFIIQKIYPEKIILKDEMENFFILDFEFEKGEKK